MAVSVAAARTVFVFPRQAEIAIHRETSVNKDENGRRSTGLTVHARDLLTIKPEEILQTEAALTIFDGK